MIITAAAVPAPEQARRLKDLLHALPGRNTVVLKVPGADIEVGGTCGLGPRHEPQVAVILPGALVCYDLDSVDAEKLAQGLRL